MSPRPCQKIWSPERLAYWYFRLNGFLTTENFIVHPDVGPNQRTDADLLAVRFAHRAELRIDSMEDDLRVTSCNTFVNVVIAEVKTGRCDLNGPWTNPEAENIRRVLSAIGCVPEAASDASSRSLHSHGVWTDATTTIRLFAIGESIDEELTIPTEQQITWDSIIEFFRGRFTEYRRQKASVGQWAKDGILLQAAALDAGYRSTIRESFGLRLDDVQQ